MNINLLFLFIVLIIENMIIIGSLEGIIISVIELLIGIIWYYNRIKKLFDRDKRNYQALLYIKSVYNNIHFYSKDHQCVEKIVNIFDKKNRLEIAMLSNDKTRLNRIEIFLRNSAFSLFKDVFLCESRKPNKINALLYVCKYAESIYGEKNKKNIVINFLIYIIFLSTLILLFRLFFFFSIDSIIIKLAFIICSILFLIVFALFVENVYQNKDVNKSIDKFFIHYFTYANYMTPYSAFETSLRFLPKKDYNDFKRVLNSYLKQDIDTSLELIDKSNEDIYAEGLMLSFRLSYNNMLKESDYHDIDNYLNKLNNFDDLKVKKIKNLLDHIFFFVVVVIVLVLMGEYNYGF